MDEFLELTKLFFLGRIFGSDSVGIGFGSGRVEVLDEFLAVTKLLLLEVRVLEGVLEVGELQAFLFGKGFWK